METINISVMIACLICVIITTLVPLIVSIIMLVRKKWNVKPFFIGVLAFFISQIVLRIPLLNILSNVSKEFTTFYSSILGTILIGGLSAGLFEETARLIGAKIVSKKDALTFKDSLSFGFGHALCEIVLLVGLTQFSNLIVYFMINAGNFHDIMISSGIKESQYAQYLQQYTSVQAIDYVYSLIERCSSIMFHVMNTILVFYGVKSKKYWFYLLAILLHTIFNSIAVLIGSYCGYLVTEIVLLIFSTIGLTLTIKKLKKDL